MKLVLDTNALWSKPFYSALSDANAVGLMSEGRIEVVLPAIAYAERVRQLRRDGRDVERWRDQLEALGITIEPFGPAQAQRLSDDAGNDRSWASHARDMMVACHVTAGREAVTDDMGPAWAGVARIRPADAAQAIRTLVG